MSRDLDAYYEAELDRLYHEAGEFARRRGKIAARLKMGSRGSQDPHVERLLQGFAFVAAGIRQRLDEDFPLLAETLLSALHPHLLQPRPSMAIVRLTAAAAVSGVPGGYPVPENTYVTAAAMDGSVRKYKTRYPVKLLPVEVADAELLPVPPGMPVPDSAVTMLTLRLRVTVPGQTFGSLGITGVRLFLNTPRHQRSALYGFLFSPLETEVHAQMSEGELHGAAKIVPVGFDTGEGVLPYAAPTPEGYQLLADYFTFPEKFCFFDVMDLPPGGDATEMEIRIFGGPMPSEMVVRGDHFLLGCSPAVNLFETDLHLSLTHEQPEYRLAVADEFGNGCHVYCVDTVTAVPARGGRFNVDPFYPFRYVDDDEELAMFYLVRRRGEDVYLALVDQRNSGSRWEPAQLSVSALCFHGPSGSPLPPHPVLAMPERQNAVERVDMIGDPTRSLFPESGQGSQWRLMSHLVLNHLSLSGGGEGAAALREILRLYDWDGGVENRSRIGGVRSINSRRRIFRPDADNPDLLGCFLGGLEVDVAVRDEIAGDALFAAVLESFLAGHATLNTPLRIRVCSELPGGKSWLFPTRMGARRLI